VLYWFVQHVVKNEWSRWLVSRQEWVEELFNGNERRFLENLRLTPSTFFTCVRAGSRQAAM
jgi:hypothetical protein